MSEVRDNEAASRYELTVDGDTAFAAYELEGGVLALTHTVTPPAQAGRGLATRLVAGALDDARARGLKIEPRCAFVAAYVERHPEARDLLAGQAGATSSDG